MIEILAGGGFENAVKELGLNAEKKHDDGEYQVWEVDMISFGKLCLIADDSAWKEHWGWWRHCTGCNLVGSMTHQFIVNGKTMLGFVNEQQLQDFLDYHECEEEEDRLTEEDYFSTPYGTLTEYLCDEIGASTEKNICAISVDLAKMNGMTMAELFDRYQSKGT